MAGSNRQLDWILGGGALGVVMLVVLVSRDSVGLMEGLRWLFGGLFLIGSVVAALLVAWHLGSRPTTPTTMELALRFEAVRFMSGAQSRSSRLTSSGRWDTKRWYSGDQGVDVIVNRRGERVAVQCKNHKRPVGNRPVQEVYAGARHHRCVGACVVAPAGYTTGAIALARSTGVSLYDADTIRQWIRKVDEIEKERESEAESEIRQQNTPITKEITQARKRLSGIHIPTTPRRVRPLPSRKLTANR